MNLLMLLQASPDISFSLIVSIATGLITLGTAFSYFFSLRERVSKLEVKTQAQEEQIYFLRSLTNTIGETLNVIKNDLTEIKTAFHYYRENK